MTVYYLSIHVPLAGNVKPYRSCCAVLESFYPRSPCGERQLCHLTPRYNIFSAWLHQRLSIHVPLAGNVSWCRGLRPSAPCLSIHVPLAGNVLQNYCFFLCCKSFYPRSPCGERLEEERVGNDTVCFLSTFPLRGTSLLPLNSGNTIRLSIHVPLAGNVRDRQGQRSISLRFLSTFPLRGTSPPTSPGDSCRLPFYPRSPCGERLKRAARALRLPHFLSTFPLRGTSLDAQPPAVLRALSIHVPLAGNVI